MRDAPAEGEVELKYPIRGIFFACCASVGNPSARSKPPTASEKIVLFM
jgi:hypothetical protein